MDYGFDAVIASSFADIFYNNCFKNGLLPIILKENDIKKIVDDIKIRNAVYFIDLENQIVSCDNFEITFEIDQRRKKVLIEGLDDISETLKLSDKIKKYEKEKATITPWMFND